MALRVGEEQTRGRGVGCGGPVLGHGLHEHFPTERKERGLVPRFGQSQGGDRTAEMWC